MRSCWQSPCGHLQRGKGIRGHCHLSSFSVSSNSGLSPTVAFYPGPSLPLPHWHLGSPICCTPAAPQHPLLFCPFRPSPGLAFQELQPHSLALILSSPPAPPYIAGQELGPRDLAHPPVSQSVGRETLQALRPRVLILYSHCTPHVSSQPVLTCTRSQVSLSVSASKRSSSSLTFSLPPFFSCENQSPERGPAETGQDLRHCTLMHRSPAGRAPGTEAGSSHTHQPHPAGRLASKAIYLPLEDPEAREQTSGFCRISPTLSSNVFRAWELEPGHACTHAHTCSYSSTHARAG